MNKRYIGLYFLFVTMLFVASIYNRLPEQMVTHFDVHGKPDGYSSRFVGALLMPLIGFAVVGVLYALPRLLPRQKNFERFEDTYWFVCNVIIAFLCALTVVSAGYNLGWPVSMPTFVLLGIGMMFVVLGNVLPKTRSNWLMGIRTPWTLDSDYVWQQTHRLGGKTFVLGGLVTMVAAFLPANLQPIVGFGGLIFAGFIPVVYSYFVWRKEQK